MKQKNLVLMVVAVGCGLVAAFLTTQINAKPKVEMVKVLVASKDLAVGTMLTEAEYDKLVTSKEVSKESLPPQFATTKEELVGKRLSRPVLKDETFAPGALSKGGLVTLPEGKDMISLPMSASSGAGGFVGPGSKVDILAGLRLGDELRTFPLMVDVHVLAVNQHVSYDAGKGTFPDMTTVSLAVTQEEALLLTLAKQRGCTLELLLRHSGKAVDKEYDIKKIRKLLEDPQHKAKTVVTDSGKSGDIDVGPWNPPIAGGTPTAPGPTEKKEFVKVWVAKENIPANTELTADLVKTKFSEYQLPKEYAEGACTDLSAYYTKALKTGASKGQWVTLWMVGEQQLKSAPQYDSIENLPKPGPNDPARPDVRPEPGALPYRDIAQHGPSGTIIYRYVEVKPDVWKLAKVMTPEEAARPVKQPAAAPKTPEKAPETKVRD